MGGEFFEALEDIHAALGKYRPGAYFDLQTRDYNYWLGRIASILGALLQYQEIFGFTEDSQALLKTTREFVTIMGKGSVESGLVNAEQYGRDVDMAGMIYDFLGSVATMVFDYWDNSGSEGLPIREDDPDYYEVFDSVSDGELANIMQLLATYE